MAKISYFHEQTDAYSMLMKLLLIPLLLLVSYAYPQQSSYQFSSLNVNNGLSHNQVNYIYKDAKGFMWFGTMSGLNRYDGYSFKIFRHNVADSNSISDDYIMGIYPAPDNRLYIKTRNGDDIYDPVKEQFSSAAKWLQKKGLSGLYVNSIAQTGNTWWVSYTGGGLYKIDSTGHATKILIPGSSNIPVSDLKKDAQNRLVILYNNGRVEKLDVGSNRVIYRNNHIIPMIERQPASLRFFIDTQDDIWIYMPENDFGVIYLNPAKGTIRQLSSRNGALNNDIVNSIVQDDKNMIWIGTDHGGVNLVNKSDFSSHFLLNKEEDPKSVAENAIYALYKDNFGIVWCGTYKRGISYFTENMLKFPLFKHSTTDKQSLSYNDVNCFAEDKKGNIWIGTNGGGLIYYDRGAGTFTRLQHNPADDNSISKDVIVSLYVDEHDNLWIGYYFGGMDYYNKGRITHYQHNDKNPNSLANKTVWKIYRDKRNNFWAGTLGGGLDRFDPGNSIFYHNNVNQPASVHSNFITAFAEDKKGNLWIATAYGIDVLDNSKGIFVHYLAATHQLSNDNVFSLLYDRNGHMWAGTRSGLNVFDETTQTFKSFTVKDGLPDNNIISILEDNQGYLWVSTSNGLSKVTVKEEPEGQLSISCRNYDDKDGLQGNAFNVNAACKLRSGELIFGGADGFNLFNPASLPQNTNKPAIVLTGLQLSNKIVEVNEKVGHRIILPSSLSEIKEIVLKYNENDFSIDFAALNFTNTDKNQYAYKLTGFNKEWLTTDGKTRRITYTNINPGTYTLMLKAANEDGYWNEEGISLTIRIKPPFWKTPLAYIIYIVLAVSILLLLRRRVIKRAHTQFVLQQERREAQRMHELDMMKIKLFTNVSHEFRTPVSLILSPIEEIIQQTKEQEDKNKFQLIYRNAKRLLNLVNQLMDFRRMEMHELKLDPVRGDIAGFIKDVACSFTDLAERKQINFSYQSSCSQLYTSFDHDKIERILFNLLSNAFKFTPQGGTVSVEMITSSRDDKTWLEIRVKDTGIGIPPERHEKVFEQFFQSDMPGGFVNRGSGIGLAITKEFVKLNNGTITVESEVNKGSCFIVQLPFEPSGEPVPQAEPVLVSSPVPAITAEEEVLPSPAGLHEPATEKQTILLIEDNDDFRFYLKENLKAYYNIIEAADGGAGWQKTLSGHPDLVVSDINMPVMDGVELCGKIKHDNRTRHIPVILLTAMAGEEEQLKGLETGAADYMVKPFNFEIMLSRIRNLLVRQTLVKHIIGSLETADEGHVPSPNEKFLEKVLAIVEKNLSNAGFSVEELSRELCMNRVSVYRRIFSLTGQTPVEFIRTVRLKKAAQLLSKTEMNVTEVAYEVGFNNPKYFAKYFKMAYNMLPSAYVASMRK
ncbi:hybrid sensor histidine kinase/response regulator [Chitinophaga ginsengisoli]|uniref:histidine kinase n=1 Tax=Chitinophaga ginsengisoli TaxID=363837 RepID=A0A2P8GDZ6_9BACT|nr:hybrid sensor histidine kinase/response regulator transcription factor [Chitinophaga ginsengisoli]PSL32208.1 signal transduction histidine kinase [Chitinophaga ginsengisoli]